MVSFGAWVVLWYAEEMLCKSMVSKCVVGDWRKRAKRGEARGGDLGLGGHGGEGGRALLPSGNDLSPQQKGSARELQAADWTITQLIGLATGLSILHQQFGGT